MKTNTLTNHRLQQEVYRIPCFGMYNLIRFSVLIMMLTIPMISNAVDIRGRIDRINPLTQRPIPYANVEVKLLRGNSIYSQTRTGRDGIYYLNSINPGPYTIMVDRVSVPITINVNRAQDIGPILVR